MLRKYTINESAFKSLTKETAYALGFIAADGCLSPTNRCLVVVSTDLDILTKVRAALGSNHPITIQRRRPHEFVCHRLAIGGKEFYESLTAIGLTPRKSRTLTVPAVSDALFFHFLRGYFDGDGSVIGNGNGLRISFTCGSARFFKQIAERVHNLIGIPSPVIRAYPPPQAAWQMNYYGTNAFLIADRMYADAGDLYLPRKRERIEERRAQRVFIQQPKWAIISDATKHCRRCHETKGVAEFCRNRRMPDGRSIYCRPCSRTRRV